MTATNAHTVRSGDTLGSIARQYQKSVPELIDINHLDKPDRLAVGQTIYLDRAYANSVQVVLLDALRYPIEGLKTMLKFDGQEISIASNKAGMLPLISTQSIDSVVEVWVENARKEWSLIGKTVSGLGQQWLTLVSPALKFDLPLQPHDDEQGQKPYVPAYSKERKHDGKAEGEPIKPGHSLKKRRGKAYNTIELQVDIPQDLVNYFKLYKNAPITEDDWAGASRRLECESDVLKAISVVESGGASAFWALNDEDGVQVPKILFERHFFHRLTCANGPSVNTKAHTYHGMGIQGCKSPYDEDPDISWPVGFRKAKHKGEQDAKMQDGVVEQRDVYSDAANAYLRLIKAFRKSPDAALKSVSWGKFQVMGENHLACGMPQLDDFMQAMCSGEKGQLQLLAGFIQKNPRLHKAVQEKDWANIALNYNGPGYKTYAYDTKLATAYIEIKKKGAA